ncbi:MAG: response regulator transcription factor [Bryobacterales bacterium]|nr:response regulator transcription factor [Bryobacterales bacterium]
MARILLVEDEPPLLNLLERYLVRSGHEVNACATAAEAWREFEAEPDAYSIVVADLTLPDGSGVGLVRRMLEWNGSLWIIVCTGYPFDLQTLGMAEPGRGAVLQKPFLPRVLGEVVEGFTARSSVA